MDIMTYEAWKNIPGKSMRKEALINLRRNFSDKDIRETWGMKPANWYNLVSRYTKGDVKQVGPGRPRKKPTEAEIAEDETNEPVKREFQNDIPSDRRWPRKNVVDAEYQIVDEVSEEVEIESLLDRAGYFIKKVEDEQKEMHRERAKANGGLPSPAVDLPFPTIKGTPSQLRKQFEGIALFLEGLEGEDTRFEIRLSVVNAPVEA